MIQETLENLFNNDNIQGKKFRNKERQKNESLSKLKKEIDHISSTDVITSTLKSCNQKQLNAILKHNCIGDMRKSNILRVNDQTLRFMRHKEGSQLYKGKILYYNKWNKKWNSNKINLSFIEHHLKNLD